MRRVAIGLAVVAVLATLAAWFAGLESDESDVAADGPEGERPPSSAPTSPRPGGDDGSSEEGLAAHLAGRANAPDRASADATPLLVRGHVYREGTRDPVAGAPVFVSHWGDKVGPGVSGRDGAFEIRGREKIRDGAHLVVLGNGWADTETATGRWVGRDYRWALPARRDGQPIEADVEVVAAAKLGGLVRLPDGRPAVGATVRPVVSHDWQGPGYLGPWGLVDPVSCDAGGRFAFRAVPEGEAGHLRADLDGLPPAFSEPVTVRRGEATTVEFGFASPRYVDVEVVRIDDGVPVGDAQVVVQVGLAIEVVSADAQGRARFGPLGEGPASAQVRAKGFLFRTTGSGDAWGREFIRGDGPDYRARLELTPSALIGGRIVLPEGASVPEDWGVEVYRPETTTHEAWATWGRGEPDGSFRAEVPAGHRYGITFLLDDHEGKDLYGRVEADAGDEGVVLVAEIRRDANALPEGTPVWELRVVGPGRAPVRAAIEVRAERDSVFQDLYDRLDETDAGGRARIPVDPRAHPVWVSVTPSSESTGPRLGAVLAGPLGGEGGERQVRLLEARAIAGRVLSADGRPAQGIRVEAQAPEPEGLPSEDFWWRPYHRKAMTDAHGRFVFPGLGEPEYVIRVKSNDVGAVPLPARAATGRSDVEIRLLPSAPIELFVRDADGEPLSRARIVLEQQDGARGRERVDYYLEKRRLMTGVAGRVRIGGLEIDGRFDLWVEPPRARNADLIALHEKSWRPTREATFRLPRARAIGGVVRTPDGQPVPRARVGLWARAGEEPLRAWADAEGRFRFARAPPGEVRVAAVPPGASLPEVPLERAIPADADAGAAVSLVLPSQRDLLVRLDAENGPEHRIPRLTLTRIDEASKGADGWEVSLRQGRVRYFGLDPEGTYRVWGVERDGPLYVMADVEPGATGPLTLTPRAGGEIRVRALVPHPAASVYVELVGRGVEIRALADGQEPIVLRGVPPGRWRIRASRDWRGGDLTAEAMGAAGETVELDLRAR